MKRGHSVAVSKASALNSPLIKSNNAIKTVEHKFKEFDEFEFEHKITLPTWYKSYMLAREDLEGMKDRPFEFVYNAMKQRP